MTRIRSQNLEQKLINRRINSRKLVSINQGEGAMWTGLTASVETSLNCTKKPKQELHVNNSYVRCTVRLPSSIGYKY